MFTYLKICRRSNWVAFPMAMMRSWMNRNGGLLSSLSEHFGLATILEIIARVCSISSLQAFIFSMKCRSMETFLFGEVSGTGLATSRSIFVSLAVEDFFLWNSSIPFPLRQCWMRPFLSIVLSMERRPKVARKTFVFRGSNPATIFVEDTDKAAPLPTLTR